MPTSGRGKQLDFYAAVSGLSLQGVFFRKKFPSRLSGANYQLWENAVRGAVAVGLGAPTL
jgi:hypothetical protein